MLDNIFSPLFAVSIDPSSDPALHYFLGGLHSCTPTLLCATPLHSVTLPHSFILLYNCTSLLHYFPTLIHHTDDGLPALPSLPFPCPSLYYTRTILSYSSTVLHSYTLLVTAILHCIAMHLLHQTLFDLFPFLFYFNFYFLLHMTVLLLISFAPLNSHSFPSPLSSSTFQPSIYSLLFLISSTSPSSLPYPCLFSILFRDDCGVR
jgi:hypothetical protein